jgi:hypothetical protein
MIIMKVKIKLPKDIAAHPDAPDIAEHLLYAAQLPDTIDTSVGTGDEHNMWEPNHEPLLGQLEDDIYAQLEAGNTAMMAEIFIALDLPLPAMEKSFGSGLIKAQGKKPTLREMIDINRAKRDKFIQYLKDMNPFKKADLAKIDKLLKTKLPNYAKISEDLAVRAGFIAKARSEADELHLTTVGAVIDRVPQTIALAEKLDVVLTLKERDRLEDNGITTRIAPLTPQETRAVTIASHHAADKMTEVSDRHRSGVKQTILRAQKERWEPQKLSEELYDQYGDQNRDWRRVAITESAMAASDAFVAGCEEGQRVIGMGSHNACKYCKQYVIGKEFTVLANPPEKDTYTTDMKHMWVGKSNYGRKVAEYIPCVPVHVLCRCRLHKVSRFYETQPDGQLKLKTTAQLIQEERARLGLAPDPNLM